MKIIHLQLNTSTLKDPESIIQFIKDNQIDVACLQEVSYTIGTQSPLRNMLPKGFYYSEGINYIHESSNRVSTEAIISKFPIIDEMRTYYNSPSNQPLVIKKEDELSGSVMNDVSSKDFPYSRGVKHSIKPRCVLSILVQTPSGFMKVINSHFNVSDLCTETTQMFDMSKIVYSLIKNSKDYPTIFSGDLNIRAKSYSVEKIKEVLTCHTEEIKDTLAVNHVARKDFPEGLPIDHVFSKGMQHLSTKTVDIDFSDHKAIISEFEM
ncbi:MAG: endonuclease/exonuclease/phosphatase family protein [bacterium]